MPAAFISKQDTILFINPKIGNAGIYNLIVTLTDKTYTDATTSY
jgi:hypothetical protein